MPSADADAALRVLLAEDAESDARLLEELLRQATLARFTVRRVGTLREAIEACAAERPDVLLLDLGLPDSFGIDTLHSLLCEIGLVPVVVLTGHDDTATAVAAVRYGAQDYLIKGSLHPRQVELTLLYAVERSRTQHSLVDLAHLDDLTGLTNRRGFVLDAERRLEAAQRGGVGGVLFFLDLDGLKSINDTDGHLVGDEVLRDAGAVLRAAFRSRDLIGRIGGDEFAALADGLPADDLRTVTARPARSPSATTCAPTTSRSSCSPPARSPTRRRASRRSPSCCARPTPRCTARSRPAAAVRTSSAPPEPAPRRHGAVASFLTVVAASA